MLELPMGKLTAILPTEEVWRQKAPEWAVPLWPQLKSELEEWCRKNNAGFEIDSTGDVYSLD